MKRIWVSIFAFTCASATILASATAIAGETITISVERSDQGAMVRVGDELFAEYRTHSGHQPIIWPLHGPTGKPVTRGFPMTPLGEHELDDHPHHRSLWFAHGDVNGHDFWLEPNEQHGAGNCHIRHRDFVQVEVVNGHGVIVARNDWMAGDQRVCADERTWKFAADKDTRTIDFTIRLHASDGDLTFGDTKEGTFSVRVAGSMKVDAALGGTVLNDSGDRNRQAWGKGARWLDYTGPVDGETVGIAIFSHPDNIRHPCRWHARQYGLYAANPFGHHHFTDDPTAEPVQGAVTIDSGSTLTLRYRVLLHRGELSPTELESAFALYTGN